MHQMNRFLNKLSLQKVRSIAAFTTATNSDALPGFPSLFAVKQNSN